MFSRPTIILDCGSSRTTLGVFSRQGDRLRLVQQATETFPVESATGDNWPAHTDGALQVLRSRLRIRGRAVLVLPAHLVLTRLIKIPRVAAAQRTKLIRFEAEQNFPSALEEVVWDSVVAGAGEAEESVLLAAAKRDVVEALCTAAQAAGFEPDQVLPAQLATLAGFRLTQPDRTDLLGVLNIGSRSATLLAVEAKRFWVRTFPVGGYPGDSPAQEVASWVERVMQEVTRSLAHFQQQSMPGTPATLHLTGADSSGPVLNDALAVKFRMLKQPGECDELEGAIDLAGAAALQLCPDQPALNLLPPRWRQRSAFRQRLPVLIAAGVLAVAALLPPVMYYHRLAGVTREKTDAIDRELAPVRAGVSRNRERLQKIEQLSRQIVLLQDVHARRTRWQDLLADLQERLADVQDVWLDQLKVIPGEPGEPLRLRVSGRLLDRVNPLSRVSPETHVRVRMLLGSVADSPFVAMIEDESFDNSQPGLLAFDFVLRTEPKRSL